MASLLSTDLFDVKGLVVVITGGGTGIGKMYATTLANHGAKVYIVGRRFAVLEETAKDSNAFGNIIPVQADVTDNDSLLALVAKIEAVEGYINLLINNAGTMMNLIQSPVPKGDIKALQLALWNAGTPEDFDKTFKLNVTAAYYTSVSFLHLLHEGNKRTASRGITSQIITISSMASFRRDEAVKSVSYNTSKAAVNLLGKLLTNLLRDYNIRSNIICPGIFPSDISSSFNVTPETVAKMIPLGRTGNLDDMGGLILFMASKAGAYVNGGVQLNDGGRLSLFPSTW